MIKLIGKYPYVKIVRIPKPEDFTTVIMNGNELSLEQKGKIKLAKELLAFHRIPLNKVRFVFDRTFTYDVEKDAVNPRYEVIHPKKKRKNTYPVEVGKPENLMTITVGLYQTDHDDFATVREIIKKTKRGVVINLGVASLDGFSLLMANLDNAVEVFEINEEIL